MTSIIVFSACLGVQILYWFVLRKGFDRSQHTVADRAEEERLPISVIVAARNEESNLSRLLGALAGQDYDQFEAVIVDDGSTDSTASIASARCRGDARFRLVQVEPVQPRKKNALRAGIEEASYERLVFTDADCAPGPGWLSSMARHCGSEAIVVGYSPFEASGTIVGRASRYETFVTGFLTTAAIGLGAPYMAVGRNLSYPKSVFDRIGGFAHSMASLSGDDDLLIQEASRRGGRVVALLDPESFVATDAPATWSEWIRQKRRHASAARYYRARINMHLTVFHVSGHAMWLAPFLAGLPGLGLLLAKLVVQTIALARPAGVHRERDLIGLLPAWELIYALYNVLVAPFGALFGPRGWRTGGERHER